MDAEIGSLDNLQFMTFMTQIMEWTKNKLTNLTTTLHRTVIIHHS